MAGYMYLGSQRVCPAVVSGGSEPEPTEYFTFKFPDSIVTFDGVLNSGIGILDSNYRPTITFCVDFNNVEYLKDCSLSGFCQNSSHPYIIKGTENIKEISGSMAFVNTFFGTLDENNTDLYFNNLEYIGQYSAANSLKFSNLTSVHFPKLTRMGGSCLAYLGADNGFDVYFNSVTSSTFVNGDELKNIAGEPIDGMVIHFPSNMASVVPTLSGYPDFGGTDTTILYDLEPTEN